MSAFLCTSYHIGRLAAYVAAKKGSYVRYHIDVNATVEGGELAAIIADKLSAANVASIHGRYPATSEDFANSPGLISDCEDGEVGYMIRCRQAARLGWAGDHSPADMVQAADCYDYQACEYDGWESSDAFKLLRLAKDTAVSDLMRDHEANGWELDKSKSQRPTGIPLSQLYAN